MLCALAFLGFPSLGFASADSTDLRINIPYAHHGRKTIFASPTADSHFVDS